MLLSGVRNTFSIVSAQLFLLVANEWLSFPSDSEDGNATITHALRGTRLRFNGASLHGVFCAYH